MPTDPRKRQKKLARNAAHRKEKKQVVVREASVPLAVRFALATPFPVLHSCIGDSNWELLSGWNEESRYTRRGEE